jgi:hypothetical protein
LGINEGESMEGAYVGSILDGIPENNCAISDLTFNNHGRTPAFPTQIEIGFSVAQRLRRRPVYARKIKRPSDAIIKERDHGTIVINFPIRITETQRSAIKDGKSSLWIYFVLSYRDFMDDPHEARFCYRWGQDPPGEGIYGFIREIGAPPKYTRKT